MWDNFIYYGKINQNRDSHKCTDGAFYKENYNMDGEERTVHVWLVHLVPSVP